MKAKTTPVKVAAPVEPVEMTFAEKVKEPEPVAEVKVQEPVATPIVAAP